MKHLYKKSCGEHKSKIYIKITGIPNSTIVSPREYYFLCENLSEEDYINHKAVYVYSDGTPVLFGDNKETNNG